MERYSVKPNDALIVYETQENRSDTASYSGTDSHPPVQHLNNSHCLFASFVNIHQAYFSIKETALPVFVG